MEVRDIMTRPAIAVGQDEPVTENGRLVGMVTLCDLARREDCRREWTQAMQSISANVSIRQKD